MCTCITDRRVGFLWRAGLGGAAGPSEWLCAAPQVATLPPCHSRLCSAPAGSAVRRFQGSRRLQTDAMPLLPGVQGSGCSRWRVIAAPLTRWPGTRQTRACLPAPVTTAAYTSGGRVMRRGPWPAACSEGAASRWVPRRSAQQRPVFGLGAAMAGLFHLHVRCTVLYIRAMTPLQALASLAIE